MDSEILSQAVQYHGPELVRCLQIEQQHVPSNVTDMLSQYRQRRPDPVGRQSGLSQRIQSFAAKKADVLFAQVEDPSREPTVSCDDDTYARMPPLESFMGVDWTAARRHFFNSLERYDVVIGVVTTALDSGLVLTLLCLDNDKARDIDEMKITAFCPAKELRRVPYQSPLEGFAVKDKVRGVVVNVNSESERIIVSLNERALAEEQEHIKLGLINAEEFPVQYRRKLHIRGLTFDELLHSILGFNSAGNVSFLLDSLKLEDTSSYMRGLHGIKLPEKEMAEGLRKQQSQKWAHQSVAEGIKHFKEGNQVEAMQFLNKALQIDEFNVEAFTARGALYANNESYHRAMEDFEEALKINPTHQNAKKYMYETLLAVARVKEDAENFEEAEMYIKKALDIEPQSMEARETLRFILYKKDRQKTSKSYKKQSRRDEERESDEEMFVDRTTATLKKLINEDKSRSEKKRKERSPKSSKSRRSRSPDYDRDIFGRRKYDGIPGLDFGEETAEKSPPRQRYRSSSPGKSPPRQRYRSSSPGKSPPRQRYRSRSPGKSPPRQRYRSSSPGKSPPRQRYRSRSPDKSPPRQRNRSRSPDKFHSHLYSVDRQSSFMPKTRDYDDDERKHSDNRGRLDEELREKHDIRRARDQLTMEESRSLNRNPDRQSLDGISDRGLSLDRISDRGGSKNPDRNGSPSSELLQRNLSRKNFERNRNSGNKNWKDLGYKGTPEKDEIDMLYGDIEEFDPNRQEEERVKRGLTANLMKIRSKPSQMSDMKRSTVSVSPTRKRSISPSSGKFNSSKQFREGKMTQKDEKRKDDFTDDDKGKYSDESPVKKKKMKKQKIKDEKGAKRKRKSKGSSSPGDVRYVGDEKDVGKRDKELQESYGRAPKKQKNEDDQKPKSDKKFKKRKEFQNEKDVGRKKPEHMGSVEEVVKSKWDSPTDERYYKTLNVERKSRFDDADKYENQRRKAEKASKFRNTFSEADFPKVKGEPKGPRKQRRSPSQENRESLPKAEPKKFNLPSKEQLDREFEGIRIHIRNDKYGAAEGQPESQGPMGVRPFDSVEDDPVSIVSAIHTEQIYAPKSEPLYEEELFEVKLKRDDTPPQRDRSKSNYRRRRSHSSTSSGGSRSPSHDKRKQKNGSRPHQKRSRSRSRDSRSRSPSSHHSRSKGQRSRSPHEREEKVAKGDVSKEIFKIYKYNKNRVCSDGKSVTIKPFIKFEHGRGRGGVSRGRGDFIDRGRGRGDWRGRGKFIPRGRGIFRGRGQYQSGFRGRGGFHKDRSYSSKHRSRSRDRSRSRSRGRSRSRSRGRSRSWSRGRSRSRDRSRSRSKHRSRSPKNHPARSKEKKESWSPPIGQGSGYYGLKANSKSNKPEGPEASVPASAGASTTTQTKGSSLDQMEVFLEQLRQKKMQAAANNNF